MKLLKDSANYNYWANEKVGSAALELDANNLNKELNSSFPTILKTFTHLLDAEYFWMERIAGNSMSTWPELSDDPHKEIIARIERSKEYADRVNSWDDDFFNEVIHYENTRGDKFGQSVQDILFHLYTHGSKHRGQVITMLRAVGLKTIPGNDYVFYLRETQKSI